MAAQKWIEQSLDVNPKMDKDPPAADGVVLEALVVKGLGTTVNALVCWGELLKGDHIVIGTEWGAFDHSWMSRCRKMAQDRLHLCKSLACVACHRQKTKLSLFQRSTCACCLGLHPARAAWELEAAHAEAEAAAHMAAQSVSPKQHRKL